jgi:hypothetical protein
MDFYLNLSVYTTNRPLQDKHLTPHSSTHHSIADNENLKLGLMAMFETVDEA